MIYDEDDMSDEDMSDEDDYVPNRRNKYQTRRNEGRMSPRRLFDDDEDIQ